MFIGGGVRPMAPLIKGVMAAMLRWPAAAGATRRQAYINPYTITKIQVELDVSSFTNTWTLLNMTLRNYKKITLYS